MQCIMFRDLFLNTGACAIMFRKEVLAIPQVAASETGTAQTIRIYMCGVVGQNLHLVAQSYKSVI